jgi:hypothetical protein
MGRLDACCAGWLAGGRRGRAMLPVSDIALELGRGFT